MTQVKCEDCKHLDNLNGTLGICRYPFLSSIPEHIHDEGAIYYIYLPHKCQVFQPIDNNNDEDR